ncbi:MAG: lamin tail domain-containing protein [Muribaculaceae bacterium]|nr:OadG family protein [Muribaculaceae bacterium]MCI9054049.1 lamin tail domain-containing protein [Muribaculaceae bacterium]
MKKRLFLMLVAAMACCAGMVGQTRSALRINEVMVENTPEGIADEYGAHHGWIELFNANFAPIEISSIYLTNDSTKPTLYPVPLGDVNTRMPKRQHVIFFADGEPNKGTFHTNFVLDPTRDNWIGIYDADGRTLIDEVVVPAGIKAGQSWARTADGAGEWAIRTGGADDYITPSSANVINDTNHKIQDFAERDANGFGMTVMAMCIVFSALLVLCLCFYGIGKISSLLSRRNKARAHGNETSDLAEIREVGHDTGEEIAAIVMALNQHLYAHDDESTILTIKKMKRAYSPWSSKIYNLREVPQRPVRR